ncbi:universal stress protein [Sorangium sp. So ce124]|uniref:universal stress protein n=1 Tax=Sorangium sp. So ce124 TaxID=3133280 RepID=UPI003F5EB31D
MRRTDATPTTPPSSPAQAGPAHRRDGRTTSTPRREARLGDVLAATDFSPGALAAVERATCLPLSAGSTLHLVHVLPAPASPAEGDSAEQAARRSLDEIAARALDVARGAGNAGLQVVPSVLVGREFVEIIRHARSHGAELIVLGRHGERSILDLLLGSTAELTVRHADTPVLVVQRAPASAYRRPLLAVELSDVALRSAVLATKVIDPEVSRIRAIHAYRVPFEDRMALALPSLEFAAYRARYHDDARAGLRRLLDSFDGLGVTWESSVRRGDARRAIVREAGRWKADLIIMGTHGRSGISRALLGSVAESVMRSAPCDVLVARPSTFVLELP